MLTEEYRQFVNKGLLEVLEFIHGVCVAEDISYSICGGTMIGAVRHKGMIPWDDDIDIALKRDDYEKFRKIIGKYLGDKYVYVSGNARVERVNIAEKKYYNGVEIKGFGVDLLVVDDLPDDMAKRKKLIFKLKLLQGMMKKGKIKFYRYSLKGKILILGSKLLGAFFPLKKLVIKYDKLSQSYHNNSSAELYISNDIYEFFDNPFKREWLSEIQDCEFEGKTFKMYAGYDEILTATYGEYMKFPPEEKRHYEHMLEM